MVRELCAVLKTEGCVPDATAFANAVMNHELRCNTAISPGWALPHARGAGLSRLAFALGRAPKPLDWFGSGGDRVETVFLLAVPEADAAVYLNLISGLARFSGDSPRLARLRRAPDARTIMDILSEVPLRSPTPAANR